METPNPWPQVAQASGWMAVGAALCPLGAGLAYAIFRTYGAVYAVVAGGGAVLVLATLVAFVATLASGRHPGPSGNGCGWVGVAWIGLFAQMVIGVVILGFWASRYAQSETSRTRQERPAPNRR